MIFYVHDYIHTCSLCPFGWFGHVGNGSPSTWIMPDADQEDKGALHFIAMIPKTSYIY